MTQITLQNKLRKKQQKDLAAAQDALLTEILNSFPDCIIHGGTAIWRCYGSKRFSEDIDVYLPIKYKSSEAIRQFLKDMSRKGFIVNKFREKENSIFSVFVYINTEVRFEAVFENKEGEITANFEMIDGSFSVVNTFPAEELVREKILAYKRRHKIRDLYDIFFLLSIVENKKLLRKDLINFVREFEPPTDEKNLSELMIIGIAPSVKQMLEEIKRWEK